VKRRNWQHVIEFVAEALYKLRRYLETKQHTQKDMKPFHLALTLAALCGVATLHAADKPAAQSPDVAAPKMDAKTGQPQEAFMKSHDNFVKIAKEGKAKLVFLGDSITAGWNGNGKEVWPKAFGKYKPANFGIGGDRTQHVLWRITNGELDGIKPKAFVIMIGTNNSGGHTPEQIAEGVQAIVAKLRAKLPETKVLILAIFPRGADEKDARRQVCMKTNAIVAKLADEKMVFYLDIGPKFLAADGTLSKEVMPDLLHLNPKSYATWAEAIEPTLAKLLGEK
jgi:beta-glucosidase